MSTGEGRFESVDLGGVLIHAIVEVEAGELIQSIVKGADKRTVKSLPNLYPNYIEKDGGFKSVVQAFVVESSNDLTMIDCCNGNSKIRIDMPIWSGLQTDFGSKLESFGKEKFKRVLFTHFHCDHVGWSTSLVGDRWEPTFKNATYYFVRPEFNYWSSVPECEIEDDHAAFRDSITPIVDSGNYEIISSDEVISDRISLIPSPGHTPGHVSIKITGDNLTAVVTGDVLYHPCQIQNTNWVADSDTDADLGISSREKILDYVCENKFLLVGSHFSSPPWIRVSKSSRGYGFLQHTD